VVEGEPKRGHAGAEGEGVADPLVVLVDRRDVAVVLGEDVGGVADGL
jgi:hypothetical protein